jgi:hypothetical protein
MLLMSNITFQFVEVITVQTDTKIAVLWYVVERQKDFILGVEIIKV